MLAVKHPSRKIWSEVYSTKCKHGTKRFVIRSMYTQRQIKKTCCVLCSVSKCKFWGASSQCYNKPHSKSTVAPSRTYQLPVNNFPLDNTQIIVCQLSLSLFLKIPLFFTGAFPLFLLLLQPVDKKESLPGLTVDLQWWDHEAVSC